MTKFSVLDLAPIVEGSNAGRALANTLDLARHAEAWGYTRYGETPQVAWLTYGVGPVIIAIILQAVGKLTRSVSGGVTSTFIGLAATALAISGVNELALLAGGGIVAPTLEYTAQFGCVCTPSGRCHVCSVDFSSTAGL